MLSALTTKVRLVRCPKCRQLLPELPDFQVFRCGGCGATLQVRAWSLQQSQSLQTSQSWRSSHYSSGSDSVPLLGNGSHDDNSDYDDQHYLTARSDDGDYDELGTVASEVGSDDFNHRVSTGYDDWGNLASAVRSFGSNPPGSVAINIGLQVENNDPHHRTRVTSVELTFILVGFILEMLSAGFDQVSSASKPLYALISLLLAIAAVLACILELMHNGIKDKDASPNRPVFGTLPDIFGLGLAVIQCVCSAVQYYFLHQHASNHMKLSPLPLFFFTCLVVFKWKGN